tara:strand:+ start:46 stop:759 length:714 start_codon:yes stop_codon:yes gene_type:complete
MAINVNTVYKTVLLILNKEQRGYMTPEEFNRIGTQVQLEIFEKYFEDLNQLTRSPQPDTDYADRIAYLEEKISSFVTYSLGQTTGAFGSGALSLTTTNGDQVHRLNSLIYKDTELQKTSRSEYINIIRSPLTKPSKTQPIFIQEGLTLQVYPESISPEVYLSFVKKPIEIKWNFTIDQNIGVYQYKANGSVDFDLHGSEQAEVILRILAYAGIVINSPQIVQAASTAVQNQNINEKS